MATNGPSGYQQRKARKEREAAAKISDAKRSADPASPPKPRPVIEPPPTGAVGGVVWAQQVALKLLHETMMDPFITESERRRVSSDLIAKIGLTSSKAATEERILKVEKKMGIAKHQKDDDGLEPDPEGK